MTSVDACGFTFVSKNNYLPFLAGVLNLQIGFASPKFIVNFFDIKNFMAVFIYEWLRHVIFEYAIDRWPVFIHENFETLSLKFNINLFKNKRKWNI